MRNKSSNNQSAFILVSSCKGPVECECATAMLLKNILQDAPRWNVQAQLMERQLGSAPSTIASAIVRVMGDNAADFCSVWTGTIQWICPSPYRRFHRRKNWFVGVFLLEAPQASVWNDREIKVTTMRSGGAGGQHVNKVDSAVRATHLPTGMSVRVDADRSQHNNRKEALRKLRERVEHLWTQQTTLMQNQSWQQHSQLERGNADRTFVGMEFREIK
jgi:peptide chain release factor